MEMATAAHLNGRHVINIKDLDDANFAGTSCSSECTLILTEGIATKSLAVAGLSVVGRDKYGLYPLKHNLINVRKQKEGDIQNNEEIMNIKAILGLKMDMRYETDEEFLTLRYGRIMLMLDRDEDGSHTKGLIINFFHYYWPSLLRRPFLVQFITPVVNVSYDGFDFPFYTLEKFEEKFSEKLSDKNISVIFYKSLESFTSKEIQEYFSYLDRHIVYFSNSDEFDDQAIILAFGKDKEDERKQWVTDLRYESFRYYEGIREIKYSDFIYKELLFRSDLHNERSIPSVVDGLTRSQRKVLYTFFKKNISGEVNLLQLIGSIFEVSGYKQSENSLSQTIISMAQDFVGSNNISILLPIGQFGTRIHGGKDAGKARFLRTKLNKATELIFPSVDHTIIEYRRERQNAIEPECYVPIIPLILVNGAEGIGTGWKTKIPSYNPVDIINNIYRMMCNLEPMEMIPWYRNFTGFVEKSNERQFLVSGKLSVLGNNQIRIRELPVGEWTQNYKEKVLDPMLKSSEKITPSILDYREFHTDTTVDFLITLADKLKDFNNDNLYKEFKLVKPIHTSNIVAFGPDGTVTKYENPTQILKEFYTIRLKLYEKRKEYLIDSLKRKLEEFHSLEKHISQEVDLITVQNPRKGERIFIKRECIGNDGEVGDGNKLDIQNAGGDGNYDFLSDVWNIAQSAQRKINEMKREYDDTTKKLQILETCTAVDLWKNELGVLSEELGICVQNSLDTKDDPRAALSTSNGIYEAPKMSTPKATTTRLNAEISFNTEELCNQFTIFFK